MLYKNSSKVDKKKFIRIAFSYPVDDHPDKDNNKIMGMLILKWQNKRFLLN
jgi:hypothetical protein